MKSLPVALVCLCILILSCAAALSGETASEQHRTTPLIAAAVEFNSFNSQIRDGVINKNAARLELSGRLKRIKEEYYAASGKDYPVSSWVFPVAGYSAAAIDTSRRHGFVARGYNYFSGNRHGGHPAYDIFIRDRNQDSRDDKTGQTVSIVSMGGGVVVATAEEWQTGSALRGGKYIWIYDPAHELLVYYAHNDTIRVQPGDVVKPGDPLATMGRSGYNAAKRRSPTHLHFSTLKINNGVPTPVPLFKELQQARRLL